MAIEVTSGNSTLLQSQVASLLVQPLQQESTFLAAGPVILDSSDQVRVPRISAGITANFVAEGTQISDGSVDFDEVTLLPSTLKALKVLIRTSNEMIRQSVIGLEAVLQQTLIAGVAAQLDASLWDGTGSSNTIKGIFRQSNIATGTLDLADPDSLIDGIATAQVPITGRGSGSRNGRSISTCQSRRRIGSFTPTPLGTIRNRSHHAAKRSTPVRSQSNGSGDSSTAPFGPAFI